MTSVAQLPTRRGCAILLASSLQTDGRRNFLGSQDGFNPFNIIYKGEAKIEAYGDEPEETPNTTEQEAIALLKKNGYQIIKS